MSIQPADRDKQYQEIINALNEGDRVIYDTAEGKFITRSRTEAKELTDPRYVTDLTDLEKNIKDFVEKNGITVPQQFDLERAFDKRAEKLRSSFWRIFKSAERKEAAEKLEAISDTIDKTAAEFRKNLQMQQRSDLKAQKGFEERQKDAFIHNSAKLLQISSKTEYGHLYVEKESKTFGIASQTIEDDNQKKTVLELTQQTFRQAAGTCISDSRKLLTGHETNFGQLKTNIQKYTALRTHLEHLFGKEESKRFLPEINTEPLLTGYGVEYGHIQKSEEELIELLQNPSTMLEVQKAYAVAYMLALPSILAEKRDSTTSMLEQFQQKLRNIRDQNIDLGFVI